jgi:hypothetical protein
VSKVPSQLLSFWIPLTANAPEGIWSVLLEVPLLLLLPEFPLLDGALPEFPDVPLPEFPELDVPLPDEPLPDVPEPEVPLPELPLPDELLPDDPLADVPLPELPLPDVPLPELPLPLLAFIASAGTTELELPHPIREAGTQIAAKFASTTTRTFFFSIIN